MASIASAPPQLMQIYEPGQHSYPHTGTAVLQDPTGTMDAGLHASALEAHRGIGPGTILYLVDVCFGTSIVSMALHRVCSQLGANILPLLEQQTMTGLMHRVQVTILATTTEGRMLCITAANIHRAMPSSPRRSSSQAPDDGEHRSDGGSECALTDAQQGVQCPVGSRTQDGDRIALPWFDEVDISDIDDCCYSALRL